MENHLNKAKCESMRDILKIKVRLKLLTFFDTF